MDSPRQAAAASAAAACSARLTAPPASTSALAARLESVRQQTLTLAAPLSAEDCQAQSMPDASPVKWHLAHTTWFFETFILARQPGYQPFNPDYGFLFNSYYNAIGDRHPRPQRGLLTRPPLSDVLAYRHHVDAALRAAQAVWQADPETCALVELGMHHEQQHQELILTDVKHLLSCNALRPAYANAAPPAPATGPAAGTVAGTEWITYQGGITEIGHAGPGFAFDNEGPAHQVFLQPYLLARQPVSQEQYLAFMQDGGYERPELWLSLGWDSVSRLRWNAPMYWEHTADGWMTFTLHGMQPLDPQAPVAHISLFEADAYARWAGARLPREAEWEHAVRKAGVVPANANLLETGALHPRAALPVADAAPPLQMFGDIWEWTASSYDPYPGFKTAAGAVGEYNGKFMCNQYVLRGGSCVTPRSHIRPTYRNFFPAEARWQFTGIRLARDA